MKGGWMVLSIAMDKIVRCFEQMEKHPTCLCPYLLTALWRFTLAQVEEKLLECARKIHNAVAGGDPYLDLRYVYERFLRVANGKGRDQRLRALMAVAFEKGRERVDLGGIEFTGDGQEENCQVEVEKARSMLAEAYPGGGYPRWQEQYKMADIRRELDVASLKKVPWQAFELTVSMLGEVERHNTVAIQRREARKALSVAYSTLQNRRRTRSCSGSVPETFEEYVQLKNGDLMEDPIKDTQLKTWNVVAVGKPGEHLSAPVDIEMFFEVLRHMDRHRDIKDDTKRLTLDKFKRQATEHAAKWIRPGARREGGAVRKGREQDLAWRVNKASISTTTRRANGGNKLPDKKSRAAMNEVQRKKESKNLLWSRRSGLSPDDFFVRGEDGRMAAIEELPEVLRYGQRFSPTRDELQQVKYRIFANDPGQNNVACCVDLISGEQFILTRDDVLEKSGINHRCAETNKLRNRVGMEPLAEYEKKLADHSSKTVDATKSMKRVQLVAENAGMLRELKYGILGKKQARLGFDVHCRSLKVYDKFWASLWKTKLEDGEERKPPVVMFESAKFPSGGRGRRMVGVKKSARTCVRMHHTFPVAHWHTTASCTCGHVLEDVTYVARPATRDEKRVKKLRKRKKRLEKSVKKLDKNTTKSKGKKAKRDLESATERLTRAEKKVEEDAQSKEEKTRTSRDVKCCKGTCRVNGTSLKNRDVHAAYENIGLRGVIRWVFALPCPGRFHPNEVIRGESQVSIPAFDKLDIMKTTIEKVECCAMAVGEGKATWLVQAWELEAEADAAFKSLKDNVDDLRAAHYDVVHNAYNTPDGMSTQEKRSKVYKEAGEAAEVHMPNVRLQASRISECLDGVRGILSRILEENPNLSRPFPARRAAGDSEKTATCMEALLSVEEELHKASGSQHDHPSITEAKGMLANAKGNHETATAAAEWAEECRGRVKRGFEERYRERERVKASTTGAPTRVTRSVLAAQQVALTNARTNELTQIEGDNDWKTLCVETRCADKAAKKTRAELREFATLLGRWKGAPTTSEKKSKRRYRTGLNMFRWNGASSLVGGEGAAGQDVRGTSSRPASGSSAAAGSSAAPRSRRTKRQATSQRPPDKGVGRTSKASRSTRLSETSGASTSKRRGASPSNGTGGKRPRKQKTPVQAPE